MDIITEFKSSTDKVDTLFRLQKESGRSFADIFVDLIEAHAIDGRLFFRRSEFKEDWIEAKNRVLANRKEEAGTACVSLKGENESLKNQVKSLERKLKKSQKDESDSQEVEIPESYQKTIEAQKNEIDSLNNAIEETKNELAASEENNDALIQKIKYMQAENEELQRRLGHSKTSEFNTSIDSMELELKVKKLESKVESYENDIKELNEKRIKYKERIRGLEEEVEELKCTNCAEDIKRQLREAEEKIRFLEDEKEGDGLALVDLVKERDELSIKLDKAEQYILELLVYDRV